MGEVDALGEQVVPRALIDRAQGQLIDQHALSEQGVTDEPRSAERPTSPISGAASRTVVREPATTVLTGRVPLHRQPSRSRECTRCQEVGEGHAVVRLRQLEMTGLCALVGESWRHLDVLGRGEHYRWGRSPLLP